VKKHASTDYAEMVVATVVAALFIGYGWLIVIDEGVVTETGATRTQLT
jgi:hypothetical protein